MFGYINGGHPVMQEYIANDISSADRHPILGVGGWDLVPPQAKSGR